jgi:hypothetical protein
MVQPGTGRPEEQRKALTSTGKGKIVEERNYRSFSSINLYKTKAILVRKKKDDSYVVLTIAYDLRCSLPPCGVSVATAVNLTTDCFSLSSVTRGAI